MSRDRLELLDYGRFAAAVSVLAFHYFFNGIANGKVASITHVAGLADAARYGYLGVDFFFIVSGYVIFLSARGKAAHEFAASRAVRLYPAFLCAMLITTAFAAAWGDPRMHVGGAQFAANLTMMAPLFRQDYVDGVYWTLAWEIRFYALVLVALLLGGGRRLEMLAALWLAAMLAARLLGLQHGPFLGGYHVFFATGALLAAAREDRRFEWLLPVALVLCIAFAMEEARQKALETGFPFSQAVAGCAVPLFFAFFVFLNTRRGSTLELPASKLAGGLTYPLYLIHAHVGYMLLSRFATDGNKAVVYPLVIAAVLGMALAIHLVVERRMARVWRALFASTLGAAVRALDNGLRRGGLRFAKGLRRIEGEQA